MPVKFEFENGVAVATIDNPPVNAIGREIREGLNGAMDKALEANAERLVITGGGSFFAAGADAREFDGPLGEPHLNEVLHRLANFQIPTIAAINGPALGGGLEITLACRYRLCVETATLGLPEVTLGIVPGAGGTQRLPRLVGLGKAVDMIASGKALSASEAVSIGLVDELNDDPLGRARSIAMEMVLASTPTDERPKPDWDPTTIDCAHEVAARKSTGQVAPHVAIDLVADAAKLSLSEGLAKERNAFRELRDSDQARALRHVFFAERSAHSVAKGFPIPTKEIENAIVVGGGNMGAAIAYAIATAGIGVTVVETTPEAAERARSNVGRIGQQTITRGLKPAAEIELISARITFAEGLSGLPAAELAIEAVFEDMDTKAGVFEVLSRELPQGAVLATNTSYLDVNRLAESVSNPGRFLGLHFFTPAHIMKLLEIVHGDHTSGETLGVVFRLAKRLGKIPVLSGVCDGFIGNRILASYRAEAEQLLLEGALPRDVDRAMQDFGMAMGPFAAQDMSGLDIAYANRMRKRQHDPDRHAHLPLLDRLVEQGRLGRKTGAGWYDYKDTRASDSLVVEEIIKAESGTAGTKQTELPREQICQRILGAMVAEAQDILDEGIAATPEDIDLVLIHGYGFPRWRGGLMHFAKNPASAA